MVRPLCLPVLVRHRHRIEIAIASFRRAPTEGDLRAARFVEGTAVATTAHSVIFDSATGEFFWDRDGLGDTAAPLFATCRQRRA